MGPTHTIYLKHGVFIMCFSGIIIVKQEWYRVAVRAAICNYLGIGEIEALVFHECAGHTIGSMIS